MKHTKNHPNLTNLILAICIMLGALAAQVARAVPYASCITNNGTTATYYLNEAATNVTVIYDGGGVGKTNNLGTLAKGPHSFSMTGHTSYMIEVTQVAPAGWVQTSPNTS